MIFSFFTSRSLSCCCCLTFETNLNNLVQNWFKLDQIISSWIKLNQTGLNQFSLPKLGLTPTPILFFDYWETWLMLVTIEHVQACWFGYFALNRRVFRMELFILDHCALDGPNRTWQNGGTILKNTNVEPITEFITCFHEFCNYESLILTTLFLFIYFFFTW